MRLAVSLQHEEVVPVPQQEEASSLSPIEASYLDQRRREARAQIDAQENLLREYKTYIKSQSAHFPRVEDVVEVISNFERKGDFVSAELFREVLLEEKMAPLASTYEQKPVITAEDIQKKREDAQRRIRQTDEDLLDFLKEQAVINLGKVHPTAYIAQLEERGNYYRAEIARMAFIEEGLLQSDFDANRQEFIDQAKEYILHCSEDPRRTVNRLHHQGHYEEAHIMAELLKTPEIQRKLAHISIGRDLIRDLRSNCVILEDLQSKKPYEEVSRQLAAAQSVIAEQLSVLNKYLGEEKFTLQQIGSRPSEIDAIAHSIQ